LREAIAAKETLDARLALLPAVIAAADAVAFAHSKRIIHRDLTPNNVLVGAHGETVVIDWGLAKDLTDRSEEEPLAHSAPGSDGDLTSVGAVIGTAAYMPPEQAAGAKVDERADVYAIGAMLYHLLAGVRPYHGAGGSEVLKEVLAGPPRPIRDIAAGAPSDLVTIVSKAMAQHPDDRYPSARELADDLKRFQTGQLVASHHYTMMQLLRRWLHRYRTAVSIATVLVTILVVGSVLAVQRILRERRNAEAQQHVAEIQRERAEQEAERVRKAEAEVRDKLEQLTSEKAARSHAETEAREKGSEAKLSKEQMLDALVKAEQERAHAEQEKDIAQKESVHAKEAEQRTAQALAAEKNAREQAEKLEAQDKARLRALEAAPARGITSELRK
jgi:hypothetical protein